MIKCGNIHLRISQHFPANPSVHTQINPPVDVSIHSPLLPQTSGLVVQNGGTIEDYLYYVCVCVCACGCMHYCMCVCKYIM